MGDPFLTPFDPFSHSRGVKDYDISVKGAASQRVSNGLSDGPVATEASDRPRLFSRIRCGQDRCVETARFGKLFPIYGEPEMSG